MSKELIEIINHRFSRFVVINDGCWSWTGRSLKDGRGVVWLNGRNETAPRVMWFLITGALPDKPLFVCHHCDNPECCNPNHLFIGTVRDNAIDASSKRRLHLQKHPEKSFFSTAKGKKTRAKGSNHGSAKITEADVIEIRASEDRTYGWRKRLSERFEISGDLVLKIVRRKIWNHI